MCSSGSPNPVSPTNKQVLYRLGEKKFQFAEFCFSVLFMCTAPIKEAIRLLTYIEVSTE